MRLRLIFLMLMFVICLDGCKYFLGMEYFTGSTALGGVDYWSKKGLSDGEVRQFYWKCYSRFKDIKRNGSGSILDSNLITEIEIEGQTCMLEHGFTFKDAPYPMEKLCSRAYIKARNMESYMIFPACQAKYGKRLK